MFLVGLSSRLNVYIQIQFYAAIKLSSSFLRIKCATEIVLFPSYHSVKPKDPSKDSKEKSCFNIEASSALDDAGRLQIQNCQQCPQANLYT